MRSNECFFSSSLYSHEKTHQKKPDKREFQCDNCGKDFTLKTYLYAHMINQHIQEKKFKCDQCPAAYSRIDSFKGKYFIYLFFIGRKSGKNYGPLEREKHKSRRPFIHSYFFLFFKDHMKSHFGILDWICQICGKGFGTKGKLTVRSTVFEK